MKTKRRASAGFTLLELTVAAGLMSIIMVMLYTIFSSAGSIFSGADARIEIYQTARAVFDTMQRDLQGCIVDRNGNIFRGWQRAWYSPRSSSYPSVATTARLLPDMSLPLVSSADIPSVPTEAYRKNSDSFQKQLCDASNAGGGEPTLRPAPQVYCLPDMVWFRTTTEASNFGVPTEVIYRLRRGFVLEKGVSRKLTEQDIGGASLGGTPNSAAWANFLESRFTFTPIGINVREFQLRYYRADVVNLWCDLRSGSTHWVDYWPVQDTIDTTGTGSSASYDFDCLAGRRARIPAAVQVTMRIADTAEHEWTDYYSSYIVDGLDQPRPAGNFLGNASLGDPVDGIKQANTSADEIGVMFRGVIFIPTYISAMGLKRSDL